VIQNAKSVFRVAETVDGKFRRSYLYTAIPSIPLVSDISATAYFMVIVSEDTHTNLKFVTAYHVQNHNRFLQRIEPGVPYLGN
jgi:hypothetical protein